MKIPWCTLQGTIHISPTSRRFWVDGFPNFPFGGSHVMWSFPGGYTMVIIVWNLPLIWRGRKPYCQRRELEKYLVGGFNPFEKISQIGFIFPKFRGVFFFELPPPRWCLLFQMVIKIKTILGVGSHWYKQRGLVPLFGCHGSHIFNPLLSSSQLPLTGHTVVREIVWWNCLGVNIQIFTSIIFLGIRLMVDRAFEHLKWRIPLDPCINVYDTH